LFNSDNDDDDDDDDDNTMKTDTNGLIKTIVELLVLSLDCILSTANLLL